jgi:hypothetical protein
MVPTIGSAWYRRADTKEGFSRFPIGKGKQYQSTGHRGNGVEERCGRAKGPLHGSAHEATNAGTLMAKPARANTQDAPSVKGRGVAVVLQDAQLPGARDGLGTPLDLKLAEDLPVVSLDGAQRQVQTLADLMV